MMILNSTSAAEGFSHAISIGDGLQLGCGALSFSDALSTVPREVILIGEELIQRLHGCPGTRPIQSLQPYPSASCYH